MVDTLDSALQLQDGFGRVVVVITAVGAGVEGLIIGFEGSRLRAERWFPWQSPDRSDGGGTIILAGRGHLYW